MAAKTFKHKELYMKILRNIMVAGLIGAAAFWSFSCTQGAGGDASSSGGTNNSSEREKKETEAARKKADLAAAKAAAAVLSLPETVLNTVSRIPLPKSGADGVEITWESSDTTVIATNGAVHIPDGTGVTEVKLTATCKKNGQSAKRTFTVRVAQKDKPLTREEVLASVNAADLSPQIDESVYKAQTIRLKTSVTVAGKTITVSYKASGAPQALELLADKELCTVRRNIVDVTANLTAALSFEGERREISIPVFIKRIPQFKYTTQGGRTQTASFDGTVLEVKTVDTQYTNGERYRYTADTESGRITLTVTHTYSNGRWLTQEEKLEEWVESTRKIGESLKRLYDDPSFANLKAHLNQFRNQSNQLDDDGVIKHIIADKDMREHFKGVTADTTVEQFKALSDADKKAGVKAWLDVQRKYAARTYKLPENASWEDVAAAAVKRTREFLGKYLAASFFKDAPCKYTIDYAADAFSGTYEKGVRLNIETLYDRNKKWHEQLGRWYDGRADLYSNGDSTWQFRLEEGSYSGTFNADFTELSYESKKKDGKETPEKGKWTFVLDAAATPPTLTGTNSVSGAKATVKFNPKSIF